MSEAGQAAARPVFAAEGFVKRFGETEVLKAASVHVRPGQVTVLLGRNGSGKSTLVRCALGLEAAQNGSVIWRGDATLNPRLARMAREGLFFLPDRGLAVPRQRVETHLETLRAAFPRSEPPPNQDPLDVAPFVRSRIWQLSGGERRRVELTLALLRDPVCLIADEPLAGLSPDHQSRTARALREAARRGAAVLVTGHEVELLLAVADEVVWIVAGGTRVLGSPEQAWEHPEFVGQYLGRRRPRDSPLSAAASAPAPVAASLARHAPVGVPQRGAAWLRRAVRVPLPVAASVAVIWVMLRVVLAALCGAVPLPEEGGATGSVLVGEVSLPLVAVCVFLAWIDQRRRGEASWLANLGIGPRGALLLWAGTCLSLEILAVVTSAWLR